MKRLASFGAGASLFPLTILFSIELLDQATQSAFNVLTPNVRDAFHLTNAGILLIVAIAGAAALAFTLPVAVLADRTNRVRIALIGAIVGAAFSIALGASQTVVVAAVMLAGVSMGQAVIFPTHNSLLADYYPVPARPRIYSAHRSGISLGAILGVLLGAGLAALFSWRAPFFVFPVPIAVVVLVGLRLHEPPRGRHEQLELSEQMLASERGEPAPLGDAPAPAVAVEVPVDAPPSLGEAWRTVWKIGVLRRIFIALPFLAASIAGFTSLASLQYQETFHLDAVQRAYLIAPIQVFDLLGLAVGALIATRLAARDIGLVFRMLAVASVIAAGFAVLFALAPSVPIAFIGNAGIDASLAIVGPGVFASLSLAIPARVRSVGFSIGALFVLPGFLVLPIVGALGDAVGFRYGLLILVPLFTIGGLIVASAGGLIRRDVQDVWTSMRARAQMLLDRQAGRLPLLAVRELNVGYDGVEVLGDVAIEIGEGEIVALLGTNGAGKSTLLRAIGGVVEADHGAIVFDGRDITHLPPDEIARLGVAQVPGGEGIFPNFRVEDNLRAAAWQGRRRGERDADMIEEALTTFPILASRRSERAGNLSGGQQQMLALAMATITRPKLFLIDELSLGLSPIVVEQLLGAIQSMRQAGTAILLVEQSMNVAVAVADRVYVMETGVVRFSGTSDELASHPEVLWSIYLQKASESIGAHGGEVGLLDAASPVERTELEVRGLSIAFGGNAALDDVTLHARARRDRRHHRPQRGGQDDALRRHLRVPAPRPGPGRAGGRRHHRPQRVHEGPPRPGTLLPGLAPVRGPDRAGRAGRLARALHGRGRPVQCSASAPPPGADRGRRHATRRRAPGDVRPRPLRRQPGERAVDRLAPTGRPGRSRRPPAVGGPARRAIVGHRPARGRGHGRLAAHRAGPARCDHARRRARHRVHHRTGRPPGGDGPRHRPHQRDRAATCSRRPRWVRRSWAPTRWPGHSPVRSPRPRPARPARPPPPRPRPRR